MEFKNIECHNFSCEDREWLVNLLNKNKELQGRNDMLNDKIKDLDRIIETKEVKYEDKEVQKTAEENIKLRREINSKKAENERQTKEIVMRDMEVSELKKELNEIRDRETKDVMEFRKTEQDKFNLVKNVKELELKRNNLETTNKALSNLNLELVVFLKEQRIEIDAIERKDAVLNAEMKKKQKYISTLDRNLFRVLGWDSRRYAKKLEKTDKLIKKGKNEKARKLLAKLRMKIIDLVGRDKEILIMRLEDLEAKV